MRDRFARRARLGKAYKRSPHQEKETAEQLGGRKIRGSGRGWRKADVEVPNLLRVECKTTQAKSFSVTRATFQKVEDAGILEGQYPVMDIEFLDNNGFVDDAYCVLRRSDLFSLIGMVNNDKDSGGRDKRNPKRESVGSAQNRKRRRL